MQKRIDRNESSLTDEDDCVLLEANYNNISATSPRLKRPWLFFASARRVGKRRRRRDRHQGQLQLPLRQRLPRPSGIPVRRRLVQARARPDARVDASRTRREVRAPTRSRRTRASPATSTSASPASIRDPSCARARPDACVDASRTRRAARATTRSSPSTAPPSISTSASPASIRDPHPSSPRPRARGPTLASTLRARVGRCGRRHAHRRQGLRQRPLRQRLPRPSGIRIRRRLVRARGARRSRRRFAHS